MSETMDKKVEMVRSFFKKEQPKNHPVKNHPLEKCEEYVKNLYIDMLCVFAMYDNDDTENQNCFIERIIYGVEDTLSIADHIKRAMEITVDKVSEFIKQIQSNDIKDIFFIDALIISCANGSPTKKQTEFLAEFADMFGLTKDNIQFLCEMVICILEQDFDKLKKLVSNYTDIEDCVKSANCYIEPLIYANTVEMPNDVYYYSIVKEKKAIFNNPYEFNINSVTLENIIIDKNISFNGVKTVNLIGCIFENMKEVALTFKDVETVNISQCIFKNLEKVFYFYLDSTVISIIDSSFENCSVASSQGVIISSSNKNQIWLTKCIFKDIISQGSTSSVISYSNKIKAEGCEFYNCVGAYAMFNGGTYEDKNNRYTNCVQARW